MPVPVPEDLPVVTAMGRHASGREWLERLPRLIGELQEEWELRIGEPFRGGSCSWVAPVLRADGASAVLKVSWPHREMRTEPVALRLWDGRGAVRVYAHEPERHAFLLERCEPGTELAQDGRTPAEERLRAACAVLRELWSVGPAEAAPEMETLADVAAERAGLLEERASRQGWPKEPATGLFGTAAGLLRELPGTAGRNAVLHGDFNPGNLLAARRRPWLAIDAKPMTGDPAFDPWPLIEQVDDPFASVDPRGTLLRRTALVADELGEDVARVRAWALARHVEYVLWSVDQDKDLSPSAGLLGRAGVLADIAGA